MRGEFVKLLNISVNVDDAAALVLLSYDTSLSDIKRSLFESDTIEQDGHYSLRR